MEPWEKWELLRQHLLKHCWRDQWKAPKQFLMRYALNISLDITALPIVNSCSGCMPSTQSSCNWEVVFSSADSRYFTFALLSKTFALHWVIRVCTCRPQHLLVGQVVEKIQLTTIRRIHHRVLIHLNLSLILRQPPEPSGLVTTRSGDWKMVTYTKYVLDLT